MAPGEGTMMSWFWLNIPLMVVFFGCWAGIPLWHTLTRWDAELTAKHAEAAAPAVAEPVFAPPAATAAAHGPAAWPTRQLPTREAGKFRWPDGSAGAEPVCWPGCSMRPGLSWAGGTRFPRHWPPVPAAPPEPRAPGSAACGPGGTAADGS